MKLLDNQRGVAQLFQVVAALVVLIVLSYVGYQIYLGSRNSKVPTVDAPLPVQNSGQAVAPTVREEEKDAPPKNCPRAPRTTGAVYISLHSDGADKPCLQVSKEAFIAVSNNSGQGLNIKLGDFLKFVDSGDSIEFEFKVKEFLTAGENKMSVSSYPQSRYPLIWVY